MDVHSVKQDVFRIALSNVVMLLNSLALFYSLSPMRLLLSKSSLDMHECLGLFFMAVDLLLRLAFSGFLLIPLVQKPRPTECSKPSTMRVVTRKSSLCFAYPSEDQYAYQYRASCLPATS